MTRLSTFLLLSLGFVAATFASDARVSQILYGASYYSEYMPPELGDSRLQIDVTLMKRAGINVVRMGESSWGTFEPADGHFDFAWMDGVVAAFGRAGIKVILGTPTYSMPAWLAGAHPDLYAQPLGGGAVGYGMRQNMNFDNPVFRRYAERLIRELVSHYRDNPTVIGWQLDNETGPNGAANPDVFAAFVRHLQLKFQTPEALDRAWFLNYWGQAIHQWSEMPRPDFTVSPSYKLEWARFQRSRVTAYLTWQGALVRSLARKDQIVLHDFASAMRTDVDEFAIAPQLDVVGINVYHETQDRMDGQWQAMQGDYARSLRHQNYFVTETSAQTIGWNSSGQFPPYDGQLRLDVYANVASGANMLLYWHWASLHAGLETYWKGVLGHDLEPGRAYHEIAQTGAELQRLGAALANLEVHNEVAILYSADSGNALNFMPYRKAAGGDWKPEQTSGYATTLKQLHRALYRADVGVDFLSADDPNADWSRYRLIIVPSLYIAGDPLLQRLVSYVQNGGHVLMTFKSGFANENSAVRWQRAPGPLATVAGFTYQEFSSLTQPVRLRNDPYQVGADNQVSEWAEFLELGTAKALAWYDDPVLGRWPAITRNNFGSGSLTYEGTALSDALQDAVVREVLRKSGVTDSPLESAVRIRNAVDSKGRAVHFLMNFTGQPAPVTYPFPAAEELLSATPLQRGQTLEIGAWNLLIAREIAPLGRDSAKKR
jgi:beta-galactosidase